MAGEPRLPETATQSQLSAPRRAASSFRAAGVGGNANGPYSMTLNPGRPSWRDKTRDFDRITASRAVKPLSGCASSDTRSRRGTFAASEDVCAKHTRASSSMTMMSGVFFTITVPTTR